ncbi:DUF805 domain-containing protein [Mycobacterium sp.]|jgi:uncharacterized membrane protein YhaH (DUF805 family)|uniref:DUF805 domain-containing protein n=1 Tax=Mycobacterium sp. TaxID=1785 RepID=UPI002C5C9A32|nr:DUF805 domain-containing protein [Mycobacterium sp.]HXB86316.1 DUF805 domain-containing protein [Mycobacterium sp.]
MGFGQAISAGFVKYVNFRDRACRSEFWYWTLFNIIAGSVAAIIDLMLNDEQLVSGLFALVTIIPSFAIAVRRLHDLDRTGWWYLIGFVPVIGMIVLLVWYAAKGTDGPNQFGPDPLAANPFPNQQFGAPA